MALELRVEIGLFNTDPNVAEGEAGTVLRSSRCTSLIGDGSDAAGELAIARHRLKAITDEVATDIDTQLELAEGNAV